MQPWVGQVFVLVADAVAGRPRGRLARAEHAVRPGLLRHRRLAAV